MHKYFVSDHRGTKGVHRAKVESEAYRANVTEHAAVFLVLPSLANHLVR